MSTSPIFFFSFLLLLLSITPSSTSAGTRRYEPRSLMSSIRPRQLLWPFDLLHSDDTGDYDDDDDYHSSSSSSGPSNACPNEREAKVDLQDGQGKTWHVGTCLKWTNYFEGSSTPYTCGDLQDAGCDCSGCETKASNSDGAFSCNPAADKKQARRERRNRRRRRRRSDQKKSANYDNTVVAPPSSPSSPSADDENVDDDELPIDDYSDYAGYSNSPLGTPSLVPWNTNASSLNTTYSDDIPLEIDDPFLEDVMDPFLANLSLQADNTTANNMSAVDGVPLPFPSVPTNLSQFLKDAGLLSPNSTNNSDDAVLGAEGSSPVVREDNNSSSNNSSNNNSSNNYSSNNYSNDSSNSNAGVIVGLVIGLTAGVALLAGGAVLLVRRHYAAQADDDLPTSPSSSSHANRNSRRPNSRGFQRQIDEDGLESNQEAVTFPDGTSRRV